MKEKASGKFVLRIGSELHSLLRRAAAEAGVSLNDYCVSQLSVPLGSFADSRPAADLVRRAALLFSDRLIGLAVYGSWARGQAHSRSDVDLLVVVDDRVILTRHLYRLWDEHPAQWKGHEVEPHFVHLPPKASPVSGLWAEAALDGVILFDREYQLSRYLIEVRQEILTGRIVRKTVHGQPYWTEVA